MDNFILKPESTHVPPVAQKRSASQTEPTQSMAPSHDDIARRAYDIFEKKGRQEGQCQQNWRQAERELKAERSASGAEQECCHEETHPQRAGSVDGVSQLSKS
jgi:hypothetical protein